MYANIENHTDQNRRRLKFFVLNYMPWKIMFEKWIYFDWISIQIKLSSNFTGGFMWFKGNDWDFIWKNCDGKKLFRFISIFIPFRCVDRMEKNNKNHIVICTSRSTAMIKLIVFCCSLANYITLWRCTLNTKTGQLIFNIFIAVAIATTIKLRDPHEYKMQ